MPETAFRPYLTPCDTSRPRQVAHAGTPALIVNRDPANTVVLGGDEGMSDGVSAIGVLDPLGYMGFDGSADIWALARSGTAQVQTLPGAVSHKVNVTQTGNLFGPFTQILPPGAHTFGPVPVSAWASLAINIRNNNNGAGKVNVHHWADAAATQLIGGDSWPARQATKLTVITPLRGPYVSADLVVTSPGSWDVITWCAFLAAATNRLTFPVGAQATGINGRTIPVSSSDFYDLPSICAGTGWLKFVPFDATGKLKVRVMAVDELGTFQYYIADFGTPTSGINVMLMIPDVPVTVEVDNLDGAATHQYDVELIVPPQ